LPHYETGFWEPVEIVAIHDELLVSAGSSWDDHSEFPPSWFTSNWAKPFKQRLVAALREDFGRSSLFVIKSTGKADTARLAITGFCWGGRITWLYAAHNPDLKAAVSWYGSDRPTTQLQPKNPADIAADLKAPVLALYGGADPSNKPETIDNRQAACTAAGKTCEKIVFPDAPHGFNADYRPSYRPEAAKDGWAKMLAWFKKYGAG
jgi:dienelactone hydrolase